MNKRGVSVHRTCFQKSRSLQDQVLQFSRHQKSGASGFWVPKTISRWLQMSKKSHTLPASFFEDRRGQCPEMLGDDWARWEVEPKPVDIARSATKACVSTRSPSAEACRMSWWFWLGGPTVFWNLGKVTVSFVDVLLFAVLQGFNFQLLTLWIFVVSVPCRYSAPPLRVCFSESSPSSMSKTGNGGQWPWLQGFKLTAKIWDATSCG